jgi:hypothetical protein
MRRVLGWVTLAVALGGAGSCSSGTGPVAGTLTVSLTTPYAGADGAILLTIAGPAMLTSVTAAAGGVRVFSQTLADTNHLAVTGPLANGALLTIGVADVNQVSRYVATIQQVAANDYSLRPLSGYSLTIAR